MWVCLCSCAGTGVGRHLKCQRTTCGSHFALPCLFCPKESTKVVTLGDSRPLYLLNHLTDPKLFKNVLSS